MIESPCLNICTYLEAKGLCTACGRTGNEIAQWPVANEAQKQRILCNARERLLTLQPEPLS